MFHDKRTAHAKALRFGRRGTISSFREALR
jgi:hypothetical protein